MSQNTGSLYSESQEGDSKWRRNSIISANQKPSRDPGPGKEWRLVQVQGARGRKPHARWTIVNSANGISASPDTTLLSGLPPVDDSDTDIDRWSDFANPELDFADDSTEVARILDSDRRGIKDYLDRLHRDGDDKDQDPALSVLGLMAGNMTAPNSSPSDFSWETLDGTDGPQDRSETAAGMIKSIFSTHAETFGSERSAKAAHEAIDMALAVGDHGDDRHEFTQERRDYQHGQLNPALQGRESDVPGDRAEMTDCLFADINASAANVSDVLSRRSEGGGTSVLASTIAHAAYTGQLRTRWQVQADDLRGVRFIGDRVPLDGRTDSPEFMRSQLSNIRAAAARLEGLADKRRDPDTSRDVDRIKDAVDMVDFYLRREIG